MAEGLDLGIAGKAAIVCGSSRGLGKACAMALAQAGANVTINGRREAALTETAADILRSTGATVSVCVADVSTAEGRSALLATTPAPDILVNNAGGPPTGDFRALTETDWQSALAINMIGPIELTRATIDGMIARNWGRILNITSGAVKAPLPLLGLSNGARTGLTGFMAGLAREVARHGVTVNNLLPGYFETERLRSYIAALAERQGVPFETARRQLADANPSGRIGQPDEFGAVCAFLASRHAAYINGQNILLDGGAYPGVF